MAADCRAAGIHWNLAPVADCNTNPNNPVIGYRSFGNQVPEVARKANKVFKGMRDGGILTCAKHFPGHGDTAIDSHLDLPVLQKSLAELENQELFPFKLLIESGIPAVMTAHLAIPQI
jgi:beta-glucosidase-like glycosyl hydrolase